MAFVSGLILMLPNTLCFGGAGEQEGLSPAPSCHVRPPAPTRDDEDKHALHPESPESLQTPHRARAAAEDARLPRPAGSEPGRQARAPRRPLRKEGRPSSPTGLRTNNQQTRVAPADPAQEGRARGSTACSCPGTFLRTPQPTAAPGRPGQSPPLAWKQQGTLKAERAAATSSCLLTPTHPSPTGGSRHQPLLLPPAPATRTRVGRRGAAPLTACVVSPSPPTWTAPSLQVLVTL